MRTHRPIPRSVDVLVVCSNSTPGNRRSELELVGGLRELGFVVAATTTDYGWVHKLRMSQNLFDLTMAYSLRRAVNHALRTIAPRAIIYGTAGSAILEPADRLGRAAVRFDCLAIDNRPGMRHILGRLLERRMVARAALLLPFSTAASWPTLARAHHREPVVLPTPVEAACPGLDVRDPIVVCYGGQPIKKGLDLVVEAWRQADVPDPYRLLITGLDEIRGRQWLRRFGLREPPRLVWCGRLEPKAHRALTARAEFVLAASRLEDYGIAQLEALADGAILVTSPSPGPYDARSLAQRLGHGLVASDMSAAALSESLRRALELPSETRTEYRLQAANLMAPYTRQAFRERLRADVVPALSRAIGDPQLAVRTG